MPRTGAIWGISVQKQLYPINSATKSWGSVVLGWALRRGPAALEGKCKSSFRTWAISQARTVGTGWLDEITFELLATHTGRLRRAKRL